MSWFEQAIEFAHEWRGWIALGFLATVLFLWDRRRRG